MQADRWVSVGHSNITEARRAGGEAVQAALTGPEPKLLTVFCSDSYDLEELLAGIHAVAGDVPLIGCSTAGEIAASGPGDAGVVVTAFGGPGFHAATAMATDASSDLRASGATAAACLGEANGHQHKVLMMLTDGLAGDQQEIVRGAYSVAGAAIPLVGGCAGDDLRMEATHQLFGERAMTDAVVAAALSSDAPFGIGVRHGWRRVGDSMLVTESEGTRVLEIDGRPALDVYLERLDVPEAAHTDHAEFTKFAQTHPIGLVARRGEEHVRFIGDADFEARALVCIAEVPQGARVWFMEGDDDSVLDATDAACHDALEGLEGRDPIGVLAFDCIARKGILGEAGIQAEIGRVAQCANGAPVSGFYTYGEIARTRGVAGFHNQTLVVLAVS
jgi:hypothetical protein